jgi:hypothetical protein
MAKEKESPATGFDIHTQNVITMRSDMEKKKSTNHITTTQLHNNHQKKYRPPHCIILVIARTNKERHRDLFGDLHKADTSQRHLNNWTCEPARHTTGTTKVHRQKFATHST